MLSFISAFIFLSRFLRSLSLVFSFFIHFSFSLPPSLTSLFICFPPSHFLSRLSHPIFLGNLSSLPGPQEKLKVWRPGDKISPASTSWFFSNWFRAPRSRSRSRHRRCIHGSWWEFSVPRVLRGRIKKSRSSVIHELGGESSNHLAPWRGWLGFARVFGGWLGAIEEKMTKVMLLVTPACCW